MLILRKATISDAKALFDWRNDPATRAASISTGEIEYDSHVAWLTATLNNTARSLLVAEEDGIPVGTVRVDREPNGTAELSWTVAPDARGRGLAKRMVQMAAEETAATHTVRAKVKADNIASAKVAVAAGMVLFKRDGDVLYFSRSARA